MPRLNFKRRVHQQNSDSAEENPGFYLFNDFGAVSSDRGCDVGEETELDGGLWHLGTASALFERALGTYAVLS